MEISRKLHLVQEIEGVGYLHSMPISREVWETYFLVLSKTYAALMSEGLSVVAGPSAARLMLQHVAERGGIWEGPMGVKAGLLPEIRRLSNVVMPGKNGWETMPLETVLPKIDPEAFAEAEGSLVFFICASAVLRGPRLRPKLMTLLGGLTQVWQAQITSLDVMAFAASLPISTPAESSGEKKLVSSVPH